MQRETNPVLSFKKMEEGLYYIFELAIKDDIDILINLDQTDWRGYRIRVSYNLFNHILRVIAPEVTLIMFNELKNIVILN